MAIIRNRAIMIQRHRMTTPIAIAAEFIFFAGSKPGDS